MNFNIYLDDQLGERLIDAAKESKKSRNAVIREAIALWLRTKEKSQWPDEVIEFKGIPDFPAFESHRQELTEAQEDPLA